MKFCGECGARLGVICPTCRATNVATNKFCGECGAPLTAAAAPAATTSPPPPADAAACDRRPRVGKSRLLYEFVRGLGVAGRHRELEATCVSYDRAIPYHPIVDLIRRDLGLLEGVEDDAVREACATRLRELRMDGDADAPTLLAHFLGVATPEEVLTRLGAQVKIRTVALLCELFVRASAAEPVVAIVQNVHWSDPSTEEFLKHALTTQEVVYSGLLERRRRQYHAGVGAGLEELYTSNPDEVVELLAYHYGRSAEAEKAVDYAIRAGEKPSADGRAPRPSPTSRRRSNAWSLWTTARPTSAGASTPTANRRDIAVEKPMR
jgi:hypothetical protein